MLKNETELVPNRLFEFYLYKTTLTSRKYLRQITDITIIGCRTNDFSVTIWATILRRFFFHLIESTFVESNPRQNFMSAIHVWIGCLFTKKYHWLLHIYENYFKFSKSFKDVQPRTRKCMLIIQCTSELNDAQSTWYIQVV